jgi:5-methylcytosine-specific restriction endonuclease McrA
MSSPDYAELRKDVFERAGYRCECCLKSGNLVLEHAVPRSRGGPDSYENCWAVCSRCHRWKEAPYANGRLLVIPLGAGLFRWEWWKGPDKWLATLVRVVRDSSL